MNKLINFFLFTITLIFSLIIAELGLRFYLKFATIYGLEMHKYAKELKESSNIDGLTHQHRPSSEAVLMGVNIKINKFGIRDDFTPRPKNSNEYRILVLGNSITMGWGVPYDSVFTTTLENYLNNNFKNLKYEVINSGIGNYNTLMESIYLKSILKDVDPDEIILHFYINDIESVPKQNNNFFIKHSYLFAYMYLNFKQSSILNFSSFNSTGKYYLDLYTKENEDRTKAENAILSINDLCIKKKIKFKIIIQPDLHDLSYNSNQFKCHLIIRNFLKKNNINYIDLFDDFSIILKNKPEEIWVHPNDPHPNSKGHKIISNKMINHYQNLTIFN